jgi:hypothetical protein
MEVERVTEPGDRVALYTYEWDISRSPAAKINRRFIGYEQPLRPTQDAAQQIREAICWSYDRTVGNIALFSEDVLGTFSGDKGDDALLACDIVEAGKMRNGAKRWWCRTHQRHWGTKGDIKAAAAAGQMRCANYLQRMSYVINPPHIQIEDHAEVGIWCSMPSPLTSKGPARPRRPKIHVHVRNVPGADKVIDQDYEALSLHYNPADWLFRNTDITKVHVTPPAAMEFVLALEHGLPTGCIHCRDCGCPHLDLGSFAKTAHVKHLCGNCGRDNTWSKTPMASTPLAPLHDQFSKATQYIDVTTTLNIDDYPGAQFALWASTPAVLWTAKRPQERGIHVHLLKDGKWIKDETFGTVIYQGKKLDRASLLKTMADNTIV